MGKGIKFGSGGGMVVQNGIKEKWYAESEAIPSGTFVKQGTAQSYTFRSVIGQAGSQLVTTVLPSAPMLENDKFIVAYKTSALPKLISLSLLQKNGNEIVCLSRIVNAIDMGNGFSDYALWKIHTVSNNRAVLISSVVQNSKTVLKLFDIEVVDDEMTVSEHQLFDLSSSTSPNNVGVDFCSNGTEIVLGIQVGTTQRIVRLDYNMNILSDNTATATFTAYGINAYSFDQVDDNKFVSALTTRNSSGTNYYYFLITQINEAGEITDTKASTAPAQSTYAATGFGTVSKNKVIYAGASSRLIVNIDGMNVGNSIAIPTGTGYYYAGHYVIDESNFVLLLYKYDTSYNTAKTFPVYSINISGDSIKSNILDLTYSISGGQSYNYYSTTCQYSNVLLCTSEAEYILPYIFYYRVNSSDAITNTSGDVAIMRRTVIPSTTNIIGITKTKCKIDSPGKVWRAN